MTQQQFERVWDAFRDATGNKPLKAKIQVNEVLVALIDLGLITWSHLPSETKRGLFKKKKAQAQERFRIQLQDRVSRMAERYKLDERLALAIPSTIKSNLRSQKQRTGVSMSEQVRRHLTTETT